MWSALSTARARIGVAPRSRERCAALRQRSRNAAQLFRRPQPMAFQRQLVQVDPGERRRPVVERETLRRDPPCPAVMLPGILHPALGHGDLADLDIDEHRHVRAPGKALPGPRGPVQSAGELRCQMAKRAERGLQIAAHQGIDVRRCDEPFKIAEQRLCPPRANCFAAIDHDATADDAIFHRERDAGPAAVFRAGTRCRGHGPVALPRRLQLPGQDQGKAAHQREARALRDDLLAQQAVRGLELDRPLPDPQARPAGILQDAAGKARLPGFDGMAHADCGG